MWTVILWQYLLFGCSGSSTNSWTTINDCTSLQKGQIRDDCYGQFLIKLFKEDANRGLQIIQQEISEPNVRDFLYLEVTRKGRSYQYEVLSTDSIYNTGQTLYNIGVSSSFTSGNFSDLQPTQNPQRKPQ